MSRTESNNEPDTKTALHAAVPAVEQAPPPETLKPYTLKPQSPKALKLEP